MPKYVKPREAAAILGVHIRTLSKWEQEGQIQAIKTPSGQRRYDIESYQRKFISPARDTVVYARVSSRGQQEDLARQIKAIKERYPSAEIVSEIGGGLNFKRKKLLALLERVMSGNIGTIVVAHKDRLARFGFDWLNWFCEQFDCKIVVLNETNLSPEAEMVEDILAVLHCFSSRLSGLRKYKTQIEKDQDLPGTRTQKNME
ncbi:MAG: IS607 family transposase [Microcystis aeruginosa G11-06]|nr:IS607 family transposase [Microcystis aeruginosa WS75]NCR66617.1 IS607 family transposase [Microcystis aeruginosa LL11-07]NCS19443.1 IS607 family transposase [Microcystis aeruginosa G11-06]NCS34577.1 IS607 family transposase [Microcystis aeruginosa G11-01]